MQNFSYPFVWNITGSIYWEITGEKQLNSIKKKYDKTSSIYSSNFLSVITCAGTKTASITISEKNKKTWQ
jgi:hypothetical protein